MKITIDINTITARKDTKIGIWIRTILFSSHHFIFCILVAAFLKIKKIELFVLLYSTWLNYIHNIQLYRVYLLLYSNNIMMKYWKKFAILCLYKYQYYNLNVKDIIKINLKYNYSYNLDCEINFQSR